MQLLPASHAPDSSCLIFSGITLADEQGKHPKGPCTWQFNFKFSLNEDMYAQDSIDLLNRSGIQFKRHEEEGYFTEIFKITRYFHSIAFISLLNLYINLLILSAIGYPLPLLLGFISV